MAQEQLPAAYDTVEETRAALKKGIDVLKAAADEARNAGDQQLGKDLDFCEGVLIDLEDALTQTKPPTAARFGVNSGC